MISKVSIILFEHHYDNMIIKNYKFSDIHKLLKNNGFRSVFKIKMPFRKVLTISTLKMNNLYLLIMKRRHNIKFNLPIKKKDI